MKLLLMIVIVLVIDLGFVSCHHHIFAPKLPPWTIVCDANGRYNYSWDNGEVNPYVPPFRSSEEAARDMETAKRSKADLHVFEKHDTEGYKPCPDQTVAASSITGTAFLSGPLSITVPSPTSTPSTFETLTIQNPRPHAMLNKDVLIIYGASGGSITIHLDTGKAEFSGKITPDEAAKSFWRVVEELRHQQAVEELRSQGVISN